MYLDLCIEVLNRLKEQEEIMELVSDKVVEAIQNRKRVYFFGTGHSHMIAEEVYTRAGGYASFQAILLPELMLHQAAGKSTEIERLSGYANVIIELFPMEKGDVLFIVSNSGRNAVPIELCTTAKEKGVTTVAITSLHHSSNTTSRNGKERLFEIADFVIDNLAEPGDASLAVNGTNLKTGPISTITGVGIVNTIQAKVIEKLVLLNIEPEVYISSNLDNTDQRNADYFKKYHRR